MLLVTILCVACEFKLKPNIEDVQNAQIEIKRYDRLESRYLTTGDFSALQQMNTEYPMETRTLLEKVLQLGEVNDPNISHKFLMFYQDSVLQTLLSDAETQYANMDDLNQQFNDTYEKLHEWLPTLKKPLVYAQIGALDQSVIVGNGSIGICLDKYLGSDYPLYKNPLYGYSKSQLATMTRSYIVPDCAGFYLLSLYPMPQDRALSQQERDMHIGKIQWVINQAYGKHVFNTVYTRMVDRYMKSHNLTIDQMLRNNNYSEFRKTN